MKVTGDFGQSYFSGAVIKGKEVPKRVGTEDSLEELCHKQEVEEEK